MKRQSPFRIFVVCIALAATVSGCSARGNAAIGKTTASAEAGDLSVQKKFDQYLNTFFKKNVTDNLVNLHYTLENPEAYGIKHQEESLGEIQLTDLSRAESEAEKEKKKLQRFEHDKLSGKQQKTYDILSDYLKMQKQLASYPYLQTILSPTSGIQAQLPITFCEYRLKEKKDVEQYFQLISQTENYFDSVMKYEKEQVKRGYFMADDSVDAVISQMEKFVESGENNSMIETFQGRIASIKQLTKKQQHNYVVRNKQLVLEKVLPAYEKLAENLKALKGNGKNKKGLVYFKKGKDYYKALVRSKTGSDKSIKEMIKLTEENIWECVFKTRQICKNNPSAYDEYTNKNIKPYTRSEPEEMLKKLKESAEKNYPKVPKVQCEIKYVHESMAEDASPAFYMIPAIDSYKDNVIYINKSQLDESNSLYPTLAHEGYPGHLYQTVYFASRKEAPVRYILDYPGYSEGWATYVESCSYDTIDIGKNKEDLARLNVLGMEYNLALCSRVDFGVNYEGWSRKKTLEYLKDFGIQRSTGNNIFNSIVCEPANYLSYYIGYKEFMELKDYYKKNAGKKYNLKTYHKIILDAGPCSFDILKKCIDENLRMEE